MTKGPLRLRESTTETEAGDLQYLREASKRNPAEIMPRHAEEDERVIELRQALILDREPGGPRLGCVALRSYNLIDRRTSDALPVNAFILSTLDVDESENGQCLSRLLAAAALVKAALENERVTDPFSRLPGEVLGDPVEPDELPFNERRDLVPNTMRFDVFASVRPDNARMLAVMQSMKARNLFFDACADDRSLLIGGGLAGPESEVVICNFEENKCLLAKDLLARVEAQQWRAQRSDGVNICLPMVFDPQISFLRWGSLQRVVEDCERSGHCSPGERRLL